MSFICKLKLTGKGVKDAIVFPDQNELLDFFISYNNFKDSQKIIIQKLALEAKNNKNIKIEISSN